MLLQLNRQEYEFHKKTMDVKTIPYFAFNNETIIIYQEHDLAWGAHQGIKGCL